jgi:hypothetical protein
MGLTCPQVVLPIPNPDVKPVFTARPSINEHRDLVALSDAQGQREAQTRAAVSSRQQPQATAVQIGHALGDGEAQPAQTAVFSLKWRIAK